MADSTSKPSAPSADLGRLIIRHQQSIYGYIFSQIPNRSIADDVLQETFVTVCEKFDQFEPGTNFVAWARSIAHWKIRQAKSAYARSRLVFSEKVAAVLAEEFEIVGDELEERHRALDRCLGKLNSRDRQFVLIRYARGNGVEAAAQEVGRSIQAAYKALTRIRKRLMACVEKELAEEETA